MTAPDRMRGLAGNLLTPANASRLEWLRARKFGLGASETAAVLGLNPWKTALDVYLEKTDASPVRDVPPSLAARLGQKWEHLVAQMTVDEWPDLGKIGPTPGLIADERDPWMLATLDRLLYRRGETNGAPLGLLEIKTTNRYAYENHWIDGVPPLFVQVQVQQQLAVTGLARGWVGCLVRDGRGDDALKPPMLIEADPAVHDQLRDYGARFWTDHVQAGVPPTPVMEDEAKLKELWPANNDIDPVIADDDVEQMVGAWYAAKARATTADEDEKRHRVALENLMRERTGIARPNGRLLVTWKGSTRSTLDTKRIRADHPEIADQYSKSSVTRTFRAVKGADE